MATSDFLAFGTSGGAPVLSNSAYSALPPSSGFGPGLLPKEKLNKALRQAAMASYLIGQHMAAEGQDALDNGNLTTLLTNFRASLVKPSQFSGANQNLSAASGYQKLPGGLIIQWGTLSLGVGATATFTYPVAFPNASFVPHLAIINPSPGGTVVESFPAIESFNSAGCTVGNRWAGDSDGTMTAITTGILTLGF